MSAEEDDWKRQAIEHDLRVIAQRAGREGKAVSEVRDPAGRTTVVIIGKRQTAEQRRQIAQQMEARWEEAIRTLVPGQIFPSLKHVLFTRGKKAVLEAALRISEYREELRPSVNDALHSLGLDKAWQRAQLAHIDRIWKKVLGPALDVERLGQAVAALRLKGPGVLEVWTARVRKHRPDLWPALFEILNHD
jgi:hypothetical protein